MVRRHRHLSESRRREPSAGRRPRQRRAAHRCPRGARQGDRRRRQSRRHPAGPHRVRGAGRAHQHRCDRQLGRRRHVGPRGQHKDRPHGPGRRWQVDGSEPQQAARPDGRRGVGPRAARQLSPDPGDVAGAARRHRPARPGADPDALAGANGRPGPRARGAADQRPADQPAQYQDRALPARDRGAARLHQAGAVRRARRVRSARRCSTGEGLAGLFPHAAAAEIRRRAAAPRPAARHHRHRAGQRDRQSRRIDLRVRSRERHRQEPGRHRQGLHDRA